jgi:hypothetical protein
MNSDWSADLSAAFLGAEWHQQIYGRVSLSYQPWKNASLNIYGKIALWDNADDFDKSTVISSSPTNSPFEEGKAAFDKYSEMSAGLQLVLLF